MIMSAFTALNGVSPKGTETINGNADISRPGSSERTSNQQPPPPPQQPPATEPRPAGEVASSQRERESWRPPSQDRLPFPSANYPEVESSHKRKRSESQEARREPAPPSDRQDERRGSESRDVYSTPQRDYRPYGDEKRDRERDRDPEREREQHHETWYSQRDERGSAYDPRQQSPGPNSAASDEQIGETLRRATSQLDADEYGNTSPDGDDRDMSAYPGQYTPEQRRDGVIQSDPKKRKRNFSNRTKTGCLTCRKRKKKCDETKPECSNCLRGGFVCAGYPPQRGAWVKAEAKPMTIQIESKDPSYVPPGAYGMPQQNPYGNQPVMHQKREPLPSYRGQPLRIDPPQGRPLQSDDDRPTASTLPTASVASPDNKLSALSAYTQAANLFPTPVSAAPVTAFSDRTPKEYQRVPPLHDLTRTEPDTPQTATTLPQINVIHPPRTRTPSGPSEHAPAPPSSASGTQATAQLALSQMPFPNNRPRREKDEMLNGRAYHPFDKELVLERERCNAACWRFNNSTNPNLGVSPGERARLFREILHPREGIQISPTMTSPVTHAGRVGNDSVVEAPFACDYGYNIQIGDNVSIGRNCHIQDACEVHIGSNVVIGPNVCIYTATCPTDPRRRVGGGGRGVQMAKPVVIEDNVFIGGSVVILPGVTIGHGSTVGAGSVVNKSLGRWMICHGVPCRAHRGIAT